MVGRGGQKVLVTPPAPGTGTGMAQSFIYLGIGSLFKAFCSSLFTMGLPEGHTHFFGAERCIFWGENLHFCSAIAPNAIYISHLGPWRALSPPPTSISAVLPGAGSFGTLLHLPEIKPGLFHPKHEPRKRLSVSREPQPMSPGTGAVVGGTGQGQAPCWNKNQLLPGNADPSLANTTC